MAERQKKNQPKIHPAQTYIEDVLNGSVVIGELAKLAVIRHVRDLERSAKNDPDFPFYFDEAAARHAIDFYDFCHHSKGEWAGQVISPEPWQQFIDWTIFGWMRKGDKLRRFKTVYEEVARKNGKSTRLAKSGLYLLTADEEPGAEIYSAATKKDQARIIFEEAQRMRSSSPSLKALIQSFKNNMCVMETHSKFEPLSSDEDTLDGLNIHGGLIDELHAHKTRKVFDVLETATGSRRQPLIYCITTAGFAAPDSICLELRNYGEKILRGILQDETFFAIIFTIDQDDEWTDPACWPKANPNLGVSVKLDDLISKCQKAKETPSAQNNFKCKHLNVWVNSRSRWVPVERWDACQEEFTEHDLHGRECYMGLDLSTTTDLCALVLAFPWEEETYRILPYFFVPKGNADLRARRDRVPYPQWISEGFIEATAGEAVDYKAIRGRINQLASVFKVQEIAADPWNATQILQQLQDDDGHVVLEMRQGYATISAPTKQLEALVMSRKLKHNGSPVMRWMFDNISIKQDPAGNVKPDKESSAERIDGIVAAIMAVGRASLGKGDQNPYGAGGGLFVL